MRPIIEVENLSKKYSISHEKNAGYKTLREDLIRLARKPAHILNGRKQGTEEFWALKDVSFKVNEGEVLGIIGRNGAGKSTLLKILSRITSPTEGRAILRGRAASLLEVGTGFHPELTGRENIFLNGTILGMSRREIQKKFDEIVVFSGVEKFLDTPVKFYSSGMYVRLAFSVAAHLEPEILLIDEVLAVGDAEFQKKCLGKMKDVATGGRTVLFVSHNMAAVKMLCDRALLLKGGKVQYLGNTLRVVDLYTREAILSAEETSLLNRPRDPNLSLEARFSGVTLLNEVGKIIKEIDSRKTFIVRFEIDAKKDFERPVVIHLAFMDSGLMILRFQSEYRGKSYLLRKGTNIVECKVAPTFLTAGDYTIDCSVLYPGSEHIGHIDLLSNANLFTVKEFELPDRVTALTKREAVYYVSGVWGELA